jgi:hypothetical protein
MRPTHYTVIDLVPDDDGTFLVASPGCLERMTIDTIKRLVADGVSFDSRQPIETVRPVRNPNHRRRR